MQLTTIEPDKIFVIDDFLTPAECEHHILQSEQIGYETFTIGGEVFKGFRDNARAMLDDASLAEELWQKARQSIPPRPSAGEARGLSHHFRYYRYTSEEAFAPHYDGSVEIGNRVSQLTFLIYLCDVTAGGETRFYNDQLQVQHTIAPQVGKALLFDHLVMHEGVAVTSGSKYVLRTDVMYDAVDD